MLSYTSKNSQPVYLRLAVLEDFEGDTWAPNPPDGSALGFGATPQAAGVPASADATTTATTITPASDGAIGDRLPLPYPAVSVQGVTGRFRWEERGLTLARFGGGTVGTYTVRSADVQASPAELRAASVSVPSGDEQALSLPNDVPSIIRRTADQWVASARTPYDMALAIQNHLANGAFSYDENTPGAAGVRRRRPRRHREVPAGEGRLLHPLRLDDGRHGPARGHPCPHRGRLPARGRPQAGGGAHTVTSDDLHAWPELYFDGIGWVRFEPTPGRGAVPAYAPLPSASAVATAHHRPAARRDDARPDGDLLGAAAQAVRRRQRPVRAIGRRAARRRHRAARSRHVLALPGLLRRSP